MFIARPTFMTITPARTITLMLSILLFGIIAGCGNDRGDGADQNSGADTSAVDSTELPQIPGNIRELAIDVASQHGCRFLRSLILPVEKTGGSDSGKDTAAVIGNFIIEQCSTSRIDPLNINIAISGLGWQWVSRSTEQMGAEFSLNQYVKYRVDLSMSGTFDFIYDYRQRILTAYFVPSSDVGVNIEVAGDVDVRSEDLWSSLLGAAATLANQSPEGQAEGSIKAEGAKEFSARLRHGMTLIIDMCTGRQYTKFGTFPAGYLPFSNLEYNGRFFEVNSAAELHEGGVLMAGPFETGKSPIAANIKMAGDGVLDVRWVCASDALVGAGSYVDDDAFPQIEPLRRQTVRGSARIEAEPDCRSVLVIRPLGTQAWPVSFSYQIYFEEDTRRKLVDCDRQ